MSRHGLPSRDGVTPSCVSLPAGHWPSMAAFFFERFPAISAQTWLERMAQGLMADEFGVPVDGQRPYQAHIRIYYYRALAQEVRIPFAESVLYQDEHLVVADKPHFLPVTPSGSYLQETLLVRLKKKLGIECLVPLHRIDRETAGLVLFSTRPEDRNAYQDLFRRHLMRKHYEAIAPWRAELDFPHKRKSRIVEGEPFFRQREIDGLPNSETDIDVIAVRGDKALYKLNPVTGKKHQLRVHMYALGLPIDNDRMYPPVQDTPGDDFDFPLQLLAKGIAFTDPVTGQARAFESQLKLQSLAAA